jgi:hypothetical protein
VVPTLANNARMGQPQVVVIHGADAQGWASPPYNFALSPVIIDLSGSPITLLGTFEKNPARWMEMPYINIHDGTTHTLDPPTLMAMPQTFGTIFSQYVKHPEYKSLAPDGQPCKSDSKGLLQRYPVTATEFVLIGKETERGWEQAEDISTLLPSLKRYGRNTDTANPLLRECLQKMSLNALHKETGLSRNTILRARRGKRVHPKSLQRLRVAEETFSGQRVNLSAVSGMRVINRCDEHRAEPCGRDRI